MGKVCVQFFTRRNIKVERAGDNTFVLADDLTPSSDYSQRLPYRIKGRHEQKSINTVKADPYGFIYILIVDGDDEMQTAINEQKNKSKHKKEALERAKKLGLSQEDIDRLKS